MNKNLTEAFKVMIDDIKVLDYYQNNKWESLDAVKRKFEMLIRKTFGEKSNYIADLKAIKFSPSFSTGNSTESYYASAFHGGTSKLLNLLNVVIEDISFDQSTQSNDELATITDLGKVFIVHGHDELAKTEVARFVEKLGFTPVILHEIASNGKTIIEKIEANSNVGFGIVLYTPCDVGTVKGLEVSLQPRARQNVVFEHGYLIGKIGRKNVCALVKHEVEKPNDISGVVYVDMDAHKSWQYKVAKEMKECGYTIDMNKL